MYKRLCIATNSFHFDPMEVAAFTGLKTLRHLRYDRFGLARGIIYLLQIRNLRVLKYDTESAHILTTKMLT